ncbi:MAG TPA: ABC transporter permease [Thermoanaerobaculia bacterium]|jgi:predicted permease|nr:ABC transporter permease [Thermoanaerobaculia bacterium]
MRSADKLRLRLRTLFLRPRVEAELAAELSFHLDQMTDENIAAGMSAREARQAALRSFGGLTQIQERCREMRGTRIVDELTQDLRYAVRTLRMSPAFTIIAALSLALGIGANTAIFSLIHALLLRPLPGVHAPEQLVALGDPARTGSLSQGNVRTDLFSYPLYEQMRDHSQSFSGLAASGRSNRLVVGTEGANPPGGTETARGRIVSGNYFSVLGVPAFRGRTFTAAEDRVPGADPVVVISHSYWTRRFAQDSGVVGRPITLNGSPFTVIGIAPPEFTGDVVGFPTDIWIPLMMQLQVTTGRPYLDRWDTSWLLLLGRLKPGVSLPRAKAEMDTLVARAVTTFAGSKISREIMPDPQAMRVQATPGAAGFSSLRRQFAQPLLILMIIVGLVLVVACANVANLLLERAMGRQKEIAVRLSVGAGRPRLIRQLLTESLLLSGLGGVLGIVFALWAGPALLRLAGGSSSVALDLRPDLPVLAFTAALALFTGIAFGLAPARRATRVELASTLKENARSVVGSGKGAGRWPVAKLLVVGQFALSLLLLTCAGLFVRTLQNLERLELGVDRDHILMLRVDPVAAGYTGDRLMAFPAHFLERMQAIPGASAVTYSENGIFSGTESASDVILEGVNSGKTRENGVNLAYDRVGPDYFRSLRVPILLGRDIGPLDRVGAPRVAVVNEALAKRYFPGVSPLGRHLTALGPPDVVYEIVGVTHDVRDHELRGAVPPRFYTALAQSSEFASAFNVEIRTPEPGALVKTAREAVQAYDPSLAVNDIHPLNTLIDDSISHERLIAQLSAVFGLIALVLASIGLYGVVSYTISRRVNEIGIRMALGAQRNDVLSMVLRETMLLALAGVAVGLLLAIAATGLVNSLLFGLSGHDPVTLAAATAILVVVALLAGAIPGARATRVNPTQALRYG